MSVIKRISQAINEPRPRASWSAKWAVALSFAVIALGYLVQGSIVGPTQAFTLPPINPPGSIINMVEPDFLPDSGPPGPSQPRRFFADDNVNITWELPDGTDYTGWTTDVYYSKLKDGVDPEYVLVDTVPATNLGYIWNVPINAASERADPNPYDRVLFVILKDAKGESVNYDFSQSFVILLYQIDYPQNVELTYGDLIDVQWRTNLRGPARLYLRIWNNDSGSSATSLTAIGQFSNIQYESIQWKVGYHQDNPSSPWTPLNESTVIGKRIHMYLVPLDYTGQYPSGYYQGFDYDGETADDWTKPFTIALGGGSIDPVPAYVDLLPATATITSGETLQLTASAYDTNDELITNDPLDFTWNGASATGLFTETTPGAHTVTATYQTLSDSSTITVEEVQPPPPPQVGYVELLPGDVTILSGETVEFIASAYDTDNNLITNDPLDFTWTNASAYGVFSDPTLGDHPVTATYTSASATSIVTVTIPPPPPATPATMWLSPADSTHVVGDEFDLQIRADLNTNQVIGATFSITFDPTYITATAECFTSGLFFGDGTCDNTEGTIIAQAYVEDTQYPVSGDDIVLGTIHLQVISAGVDEVSTLVNFATTGNAIIDTNNDDVLSLAVGATVNIPPPDSLSIALSGTYYSAEFAVSGGGVTVNSLDTFTHDAIFDPVYSEVEFAVKLKDSAGNQLGYGDVGENGFYIVSNELPITRLNNIGIDLTDVATIQIRIYLSTSNYSLSAPSVGALTLAYTTNQPGDQAIGTMVFADGNSNKIVPAGESVPHNVVITSSSAIDHTIELAVNLDDGGVSNIDASIYNPADGSNLVLLPPGSSRTVVLELDATNADASGPYNFVITGAEQGDPTLFLAPLEGTVTVSGESSGGFSLSLTPATRTVQPETLVTFNIAATYDPSFVGSVSLSTNIADQFGTDVLNVTIVPSVITPATATPAILSFTTNSWANIVNRDVETQFSVSGTDGATTSSDTALMTISQDAPDTPAIVLDVTVPVEGAKSSAHPRFTLRLYEDGETDDSAWIFEATNLTTDSSDEVSVDVGSGYVQDGSDYEAYIRSTRHLWAKASASISVNSAGATHPNYSLTFPKLKAGDISPTNPDNIVNSGDFGRLITDFGKTLSGLLPDFNNDGKVNVVDIPYILNNWFAQGELPN